MDSDTKKKPITRRRIDPINADGYQELVVAIIGSVDAGKSSLVGTLVSGVLDDGKGLSRSVVFIHPHERETGRTSDISYQYLKDDESKRIITFVDLAGHETYLKTTLSGLSAAIPDFAIVCVSDKITRMTKEHMGLCYMLEIPFMILFTKSDMVPADVSKQIVYTAKKLLLGQKSKIYHVKDENEFESTMCSSDNKIIPYTHISVKSGSNLNIVRYALRNIAKKEKTNLPDGFVVEHIYNVTGHGTVLSGIAGQDITKDDVLYMGPFTRGDFVQVTVRSIHNDYRYGIQKLEAGKKGCIAIGMKNKEKSYVVLRKGLILSKTKNTNICREFIASVTILHHSTTIKNNYQAFINCGMLREPVQFTEILDEDGNPITVVRSGKSVNVKMRFMRNLNYILVGQSLTFREGSVRGFGTVKEILQTV
jgi:GTPase